MALRQVGVIIPASTTGLVGLTLCFGTAYRWAVEPVSTGAACPRTLRRLCLLIRQVSEAGVGGRCQPTRQAQYRRQTRFEIEVSFLTPIPES